MTGRDRSMALHRAVMRAVMGVILALLPAPTASPTQSADDAPVQCVLLRGEAALRACEEVIRSDRPAGVRAEARYNRGVELDSLDRHAEALEEFAEAIRLKPDYAAAYMNMGVVFANLSRWDEAVGAYRQANTLRRHNDALGAYRSALRVRPGYANAWGNLGMTAYLLGRYTEAAEAFETARELVPDYFDTRPVQRKAWEASRRQRPPIPARR